MHTMSLDPTLQRLVQLAYRKGFAKLADCDITTLQKRLQPPSLPSADVHITKGQTPKGIGFEIISRPKDAQRALPALLYMRGCSYIGVGRTQTRDFSALLLERLACKVIHIAYRLPPAFPHPYYLQDTIDTLLWIHKHHSTYQLSDRMAIFGDSSGGNIAAIVCHQLADTHPGILQHQTLF